MKRGFVFLLVILCFFTITFAAHAQLDQYGNLRLGNEYIEIVVNGNEENMGRFAVDITGGNPIAPGDDNEPLIYGRPKPWTSFSTIFLDGEYYVFGGKTEQRAGRDGKYGEMTVPPMIMKEGDQNGIITTAAFGSLEVEQILTFSKSSTTGLYDTALIKYRFTNHDEVRHKMGLRVMLDTMLGTNDGAPFRVGEKAITTDAFFIKGSLPDFLQAFDSISSPKVTAQGTIKGPDVTTPDKVYFADWGSMADGLWSFDFDPGEEFWRAGEFELDSAIALFWAPEYLEPGETKIYVTKYGLGGITVVPGLLSLGVTSPAEVIFDTQTRSFPVVAYIENTSEIVAKDVTAQIQLPSSFAVVGGTTKKVLGNMESGSTGQVAWEVMPVKGKTLPDRIVYKVKVDASNTDDNQAERLVSFTPPPSFKTWLEFPESLTASDEQLEPNPFELTLHMKNAGGSPAYEVHSLVILPPGLSFAEKEKMSKYIGTLKPGESYMIPWKIKASDMVSGKLNFGLELRSLNSPKISLIGSIMIPELKSKVYMVPLKEEIKVGEYFGVQLRAGNISEMNQLILHLSYDTEIARAMYVSRGTIFVLGGEPLPWVDPVIDREKGVITGISGDLSRSSEKSGILAEVYFKALKPGPLKISFAEVMITDGTGNNSIFSMEDLEIQILE
ncbi:MAG: cellulosome anchor protein [Halanaerobiales bacterium]|nr:cellulosome anchor protein [Halanaerobiales bacterium]